jgi:RNA polymerase sigma-70 factor, ECF subfamily
VQGYFARRGRQRKAGRERSTPVCITPKVDEVADRDPLANPAPLIRRVYAYVAYRIGDGVEAEDVTSEVFERALKYRASYDSSRGEPVSWLLGIARHCLSDRAVRGRSDASLDEWDGVSPQDVEAEAVQHATLAAVMEGLDERARDLLALRFGADLTARQIGAVLEMKTNAVEVALHRLLAQMRANLDDAREQKRPHTGRPAPRTLP